MPDPLGTTRRLRRFVEMLLQWNITVSNLISKNDEARVVEAHVLPAVEVSGWIRSQGLERWCDLGSGGGFPALPLAICGIGSSWDLIESRRTKTLFLRRAAGELGLGGVRVLAARIEDLLLDRDAKRAEGPEPALDAQTSALEAAASAGDPSGGWGDELVEADSNSEADRDDLPSLLDAYDGFTSRATMALGPTLSYAASLVRAEGRAFLWKGSRLDQEAASDPAWRSSWSEGESRRLTIEHSILASFVRNNE